MMRLVADGVVPPLEKLEATHPVWGEIAELGVSPECMMLFGGGSSVTVPVPPLG